MKNIVEKSKVIVNKLMNTGFLHIFGSSVINQIITLLSGIVLIRILTKSEYGVFAYTNNLVSLFLLFSGLGTISGILQLCSENFKNPEKALAFFRYGAIIAIVFEVFLGLIILSVALLVHLPVKGSNYLLILMSISPVLILGFQLIQIYFRYNRLNKSYSYLTTTNTLLILVSSIIGAVIAQAKGLVVVRYLGYFITILSGVILLRFPYRKIKNSMRLKKEEKKDFLKLSIVSMVNNGTSQLLYILDIFIIGLLIPNESLIASYKVAQIIPNALIFIPGSLMIYLYPYFASHRNNTKWVKKNFSLILKYFGLFNLILVVILIILAPTIIKIVFGEQYLDSVMTFRILVVGYFISATFRKVTGNLLVTQRKLKFNFGLGIFEGIINIICNVMFINYFGIIGAAITSVIVVFITSIISMSYFLRILKGNKLKTI